MERSYVKWRWEEKHNMTPSLMLKTTFKYLDVINQRTVTIFHT